MRFSVRLLSGAGIGLSAVAAMAGPPPVAAFLGYATFEQVSISPDGSKLAFTQRDDAREIITVMTYPELKIMMRSPISDSMDVDRFVWANESRLLIQPQRRIPGETSFKARTGEIFGVDADGNNVKILFGFSNRGGTGYLANPNFVNGAGQILDVLPDDPDNVLVQAVVVGSRQPQNNVYRMNVNTGRVTAVALAPDGNSSFLTDSDHNVVLSVGTSRNGSTRIHYRPDAEADWQLKEEYEMLAGGLMPVFRSHEAGRFLAMDHSDGSASRIVSWEPATGNKRILFERKDAMVTLTGVDNDDRAWLFEYLDHFPGYWYPDPEHPLAVLHQKLRAPLRNADIKIANRTRDGSLAVALVSAPTLAPRFLVVDVNSGAILMQQQAYPQLKSSDLSPMEPIEFSARDGRTIRGYLTTPNVAEKTNLPMIVLVHGGPHGLLDAYGFDPEVQLLASRGYAVLQVNYRGSGGRGKDFEAAGYGKWGTEMQDDITDGVKWAIGDGVADPKRICIFGGSYGAYAALTGAYREPDMFRCAVGMAGVYDLPTMFTRGDIQESRSGVRYMEQVIGTDASELERRSPTHHAGEIKAAVMLIHGTIDPRAPIVHAHKMKDALEKAGNPPEWLTESGEAHGFADQEHRIEAYEKILAFFAKHLGG
jgi:dipeptidyl aminopeptidase/acylaminoacyl peptidase